jgi:cold shock protein
MRQWKIARLPHSGRRTGLAQTCRCGFGEELFRPARSVLELIEPSHEHDVRRRFQGDHVTGKIRTLRVDKGFGFIKDDKGQEYFFHQSAIYGEGIADLREGDSVEFEVGQGPKGPRAENVRRTST